MRLRCRYCTAQQYSILPMHEKTKKKKLETEEKRSNVTRETELPKHMHSIICRRDKKARPRKAIYRIPKNAQEVKRKLNRLGRRCPGAGVRPRHAEAPIGRVGRSCSRVGRLRLSHGLLRQAAHVADEVAEGVARLVHAGCDPRVTLEGLRAATVSSY